ncbi:hypothetical protein CHELA40_14802 [Chelatococcus asaccharovorans]|nr:hypothetical protein CHELA17_60819 [Chelatococcus asaccharovorans]CAH1680060.1 hypothetical protein CHELA40_14802 [Chelatococcus asaccharovorans]
MGMPVLRSQIVDSIAGCAIGAMVGPDGARVHAQIGRRWRIAVARAAGMLALLWLVRYLFSMGRAHCGASRDGAWDKPGGRDVPGRVESVS